MRSMPIELTGWAYRLTGRLAVNIVPAMEDD
jgi:hypothetical protein